jgi:glutamate decarboxylase
MLKTMVYQILMNLSDSYLGADQASLTLNFSKSASSVIGQYYVLIRLGKSGFRSIMTNLIRISDHLANCLEQAGFIILSERHGKGLPLVAFKLKGDKHYDEVRNMGLFCRDYYRRF